MLFIPLSLSMREGSNYFRLDRLFRTFVKVFFKTLYIITRIANYSFISVTVRLVYMLLFFAALTCKKQKNLKDGNGQQVIKKL